MPVDEKLTAVFVSIRGGLMSAVSRIVPPKEIEDVVQETYVRVCQAQKSDEIKSPRSFMYRTARNIALNYVNRAESRLSVAWDDEGSAAASNRVANETYQKICSDEEFSFFCDAVRALPLQCRRAFVLKKVYGHSYREIAAILEISEKTVEKHIAKGITRCREYMLRNSSDSPARARSVGRSGDRQ